MKKKFYDIIPREQRSIRNIPLPASKQHAESSVPKEEFQPRTETPVPSDQRAPAASSREERERYEESQPVARTQSHAHVSMDGVKKSSTASRVRARIKKSEDAEEPKAYEPAYEYSHARHEKQLETEEENSSEQDQDEDTFEEWNKNNKGVKWKTWTAIGIVAVLGLFFLSVQFASATIRINPVKHEVGVNSSRMYLNEVKHRVVDVEASASITVDAKGLAKVNRKAAGTIVLYNAFNSAEQKLVANTRLETPEGLVFYTDSAVTIPGQKTANGKTTPGSVSVKVTAAEPGEKYNVGFKDFKLVAYKGSDRYDKIYGRTSASIGNGFVGEVPNVATGEVASTSRQLKDALLAKLKAEASEEVDAGKGEVFINEALIPVFQTAKQEVSKDGKTLTLTQKATARAVIFDKAAVSEFLVKTQNQEEKATSTDIVYTGNLDKLFVAFPTDASPEDLAKENVYVMTSGTSTISSSIDTERISKAVSGLTREQAIPAIKRLVELESIEVSIRPWWKSSLPSASKRVYVEIEE